MDGEGLKTIMNKRTTILAAATFAAATITASQANNCATIVGTSTDNGVGVMLYSSGYYGQDMTRSFSVGMWVKNLRATNYLRAFWTQYVTLSCPSGSNELQFSVVQTDASSGTNATVIAKLTDGRYTLRDDNWHFLCCTFEFNATDPSASFQSLYIDGQLKAHVSGSSVLGPAATPSPTHYFSIGGQWNPSTNYAEWRAYNGLISDVTVWSRALSAMEIGQLVLRRAGGGENGLVIYWPFTGTTASQDNQARGGISASLNQNYSSTPAARSWSMTNDASFPLDNCRRVIAPDRAAALGYVESAGATYRSWDDPATDIQRALDAACPGETILVMDGTYTISETIAVTNANTVLRSWNRDTGLVDADGTVIDAQGLCRALSVGVSGKSDLAIEVSGFTVANARSAASGGGALLYGKASSSANSGKRSVVADCSFTNCVTDGCGGGIYVNGGIISNCSFQACIATTFGGGVGIASGAVNESTYNARAIPHTAPWIVGSDFTDCRAGLRGGAIGISVDYYWGSAVIDGSRFIDCTTTNGTSSCYGGHVYSGYGTCLSDCTFSGRAEAKYGACVAIANATVSNCVFESVAAQTDCYGLVHSKGRSAGTPPTRYIDCAVTNCSGLRGFFSETRADSVLMRDCLVAGNAFTYAFIAHDSTNGIIENCTFASNGANAYDLYHGGDISKTVAVNSIFDSLHAADGNSGTYRTVLSNCFVRVRSTPDAEDGSVWVASPKFVDAANDDYRLAATSPCREKGVVLSWMSGATDLDGNPRLVNILGKVSADALPDLGCYECQERGIQPTVMTFK